MRISDWSSDVCSSDLCPTRLDGLLSQLRYLLFQKFYLITRQGMRHFVHEKLAFVYEHRSKSLRHLWIEAYRLYDQNPGIDRKSTRLNSSHKCAHRMPSSAFKKKNTTHFPTPSSIT